jgi:hypothetical protein
MATRKGTAVLFGGLDTSNCPSFPCPVMGDTWTWDGTSWAQKSVTGPAYAGYAAMAAFGGP